MSLYAPISGSSFYSVLTDRTPSASAVFSPADWSCQHADFKPELPSTGIEFSSNNLQGHSHTHTCTQLIAYKKKHVTLKTTPSVSPSRRVQALLLPKQHRMDKIWLISVITSNIISPNPVFWGYFTAFFDSTPDEQIFSHSYTAVWFWFRLFRRYNRLWRIT